MAADKTNLLDPLAIQRAEALGLHARQVVEGYMAGEHKSPFRGFSIEFTQHREYVPGDDIRHLDWKVLGRTDRYYLKQYEQETNYVAHLLLDGIQHLRFGGNEVIVFHTMDPYELEFPFQGNVEFDGLETIPKITTRPREVRKSYLRELENFRTRLREGCERNSTHYVLVDTS